MLLLGEHVLLDAYDLYHPLFNIYKILPLLRDYPDIRQGNMVELVPDLLWRLPVLDLARRWASVLTTGAARAPNDICDFARFFTQSCSCGPACSPEFSWWLICTPFQEPLSSPFKWRLQILPFSSRLPHYEMDLDIVSPLLRVGIITYNRATLSLSSQLLRRPGLHFGSAFVAVAWMTSVI